MQTSMTYLIYYINSGEIPGELSRENMISSHEKITRGYIKNRAIRIKT